MQHFYKVHKQHQAVSRQLRSFCISSKAKTKDLGNKPGQILCFVIKLEHSAQPTVTTKTPWIPMKMPLNVTIFNVNMYFNEMTYVGWYRIVWYGMVWFGILSNNAAVGSYASAFSG